MGDRSTPQEGEAAAGTGEASAGTAAAGTTSTGAPRLEAALDLEAVGRQLDGQAPEAVVRWAADTFAPKLVLTSSFGAHSAAMLHLTVSQAPNTPVVLVDTGYLFDETYHFIETLRERLNFDLRIFHSALSAAHQEALYGKLWEKGDEGVAKYLQINKVEPMRRALDTLDARAWLSGLRSEQTDFRSGLGRVVRQDGRYKVHPIFDWSMAQVERYLAQHRLPLHPLVEQGYRSIGDWHSTLPTAPGQDPREGRILGKKRECGIHLPLDDAQNSSLTSSKL